MTENTFGQILEGSPDIGAAAYELFSDIPVDQDLMHEEPAPLRTIRQTINEPISVSGPGTFLGRENRTITLLPFEKQGWRFQRADLSDCLPVRVSAETVWTTGDIVSNIVLRSGPPNNYVRMVEHIIALRLGLPIDNVLIKIDSGDPPLFNRGSLDLVDAMDRAGLRQLPSPVNYVTVKERVSIVGPHGGFLIIEPALREKPALTFDVAIDFKTAIGKQRIKFPMNDKNFRHGALARTNTSLMKMMYCRTVGKIFADVRNLGYTSENILVAGKNEYYNEAHLMHEGKSLEAVWHRAVLDLAAALALIEEGRFLGHITSYKAGHGLDVDLVRHLYQNDLLEIIRT